MRRSFDVAFAVLVFIGTAISARAADQDATAILDNAIKALGGERRLASSAIFEKMVPVTIRSR
jgi:hypothetical protein